MNEATVIDGVDYGPLASLVGTWQGDRGTDVAPEPDGEASSPYHETIVFEPCGLVDNAATQVLAVVRYHQVVRRKSNDVVFHNESGYYSWEAASGLVMQSFAIPRGVTVVAGGTGEHDGARSTLSVAAKAGDHDWTIAEAPFMRDNASTRAFSHSIEVDGDRMSYSETTVVHIYGQDFDHTDANTLSRV